MKKYILFIIFTLSAAGLVFPAGVTVKSPNAGTLWSAGSTGLITWNCNAAKTMDMKINIFRNTVSQANFVVQLKSKNTGKITWAIPAGFQSGKYILRIKTGNNKFFGDSHLFSIQGKSAPPTPKNKSLALSYPDGGEILPQNSRVAITWNGSALSAPLALELWKGNRKYGTIASGISPSPSKYDWSVGHTFGNAPAGAGSDYRIRIAGDGLVDMSSRYFSITVLPSVSDNNMNNIINNIQTLQKPPQQMMNIAVPPEILEVKVWSKDPKFRGQVKHSDDYQIKLRLKNTTKSVDKNNWPVYIYVGKIHYTTKTLWNSNHPKQPGQTWWQTLENIGTSRLENKDSFQILKVRIGKNEKSTMMGIIKTDKTIIPDIREFQIYNPPTKSWGTKGKYEKNQWVKLKYNVVNAVRLTFINKSTNQVEKTVELPNRWGKGEIQIGAYYSGTIRMNALSISGNYKYKDVYLDTTKPLQIGDKYLKFDIWRSGNDIKTRGMVQGYRSVKLMEVHRDGTERVFKELNATTFKSDRLDWVLLQAGFPLKMRLRVIFLDYSKQTIDRTLE